MVTDNVDLFSFYTVKITRWKGNYPRVFSIGTHGIATYNTNDSERTNYWQWTDVFALSPLSTSDHPHQFQLVHRKGKSTDSMRFESEHRAEIITRALTQAGCFTRSHFTESIDRASVVFRNVFKHRWGQDYVSPIQSLSVTSIGLEQCHEGDKKSYAYKDIDSVIELSPEPGMFAIKMKSSERLHTYRLPERDKLLAKVIENSSHFIGHGINFVRSGDSLFDWLGRRLGVYSDDMHLTSLCEFGVQNTKRARILMCLSETCLIERDPGTYAVTSLFPLSSIFAMVRCQDDSQAINVELTTGTARTYFSTERDSLLASLMDGARAAGNCAVHVKSRSTCQGKRWGPLSLPVDEKVETLFLKFIHQPPPSWTFSELLIRFNANVEYSGLIHSSTANGLFAENKEKLILVAINALLTKDVIVTEYEDFFQLIRRLVCSKTGFGAFSEMQMFREKLGGLVVSALRSNVSDIVVYAGLDAIAALMQPMHSESDLRIEQENKEKVLSSGKFLDSLLDMWTTHIRKGTGALVTMAMLDILTFALCAPYSETTLGNQFDSLLSAVAARAGVLFTLFQHPCVAIVKGAGLVMKALIEEGQGTIGKEIQERALKEGALIRHLLNALFVETSDPRLLTLRQLSRHLVTLWTSQHSHSVELLKRIFPVGLLRLLESSEKVEFQDEDLINTRDNLKIATAAHKMPSQLARQVRNVEKYVEKQIEGALRHWRLKTAQEARKNNQFRPVALRKRRQNLTLEGNWTYFYFCFAKDHAMPDLIWNYQTREELRECLQTETRLLDNDRDHVRGGEICWNFADFQVHYKSLSEEIRVGGYYLRLMLEENSLGGGFVIRDAKEFFADLYHRFLLTGKADLRGMCLQAMTIVYMRHATEIGVFNDLKYIVLMLDKCMEKTERDRLVLFIQQLVKHPENARELVSCGGLKVLVDLITLAHLHTSRAMIPTQSNVIEAGADMKQMDSPEWYYMKGSEKIGPVGFQELKKLYKQKHLENRTKCWASGLDTWKQLVQIPQCKWFIVCETQPNLMNKSKLASVVLDILIQVVSFCPAKIGEAVIRPVHKAKQILSDVTGAFAHIVQVLLTFDPAIVERVASLLYLLLDENPLACRVYATGVYFFIMMYTGSNILPISRFLHLTHLKQNTYSAQQGTSVWQKSVLGPLLPEAMVAYLENHGVDKFSEIYLGEFDTPEAIWSGAMRRYLIERIALHLADFSPRLLSNTRALYDYCAIPAVVYENLQTELFCNVYYLRNLTDEFRFPQWTIQDPLCLLRDVLDAWKNEVEKQPPPMTVTEALRSLELEDEPDWTEKVKRNYRKLAQKYHPDKNPNGRDRFEAANKAYEFLCSRYSTESTAPDPNRIVLILKTQSILFGRYGQVLEPYKYSGYPMLTKTIELDVSDEGLFGRETPLLPHSAEVVYHTLNCSQLNVEELRREKGLELLLRAFDRCVSVLNHSSTPSDVAVVVCTNVTRCFTVATRFQLCRDKLVEMPQLAQNICRLFNFKHLTKLCIVASECVASMAVDTILQMHLLQSGVLWHLLTSLFAYDFTLDEGQVVASEDSNLQILTNNFAKMSVTALKSLCGDGTTPKNDVIRTSLQSLLLPYGAKMIQEKEPEVVLKTLNENSCSPYLIWDNKTRTELLEYCDAQLRMLKSGDLTDQTYGSDFSYSIHEGEKVIGCIFVRIYNTQPSFRLENPTEFITELIGYLSTTTDTDPTLPQCIEALNNALKTNPGLEKLCKGKFRLFARFLVTCEGPVLLLLTTLMGSQECVQDVVGMGVVPGLLLILGRGGSVDVLLGCLGCLLMVCSHPSVVKEAVQKGTIIYLLYTFTRNTIDLQIRIKSAEVLARMASDKLSGPRVKIILQKILPAIFTEAMGESGQSSVTLFDSTTENPELIWNDDERFTLTQFLQAQHSELLSNHLKDLSYDWRQSESNLEVPYTFTTHLMVGGIYLRLFVANSGWNIRKPREFFKDLLEVSFTQNTDTDLLCSAISQLVVSQPHLCDSLVAMGYVNKVLSHLHHRFCAILLTFIAKSGVCLDALGQFESVVCVCKAMKGGVHLGELCEGVNYLFNSGQRSELVFQGIKCGLVEVLLGYLKGKDELLVGSGGGVSGCKANIVHALQGMSRDEKWGQEVGAVLDRSEVWGMFRDQKHDLFLTDKTISGYLGSSSGSVAGYLTQGSTTTQVNLPPPIVEHCTRVYCTTPTFAPIVSRKIKGHKEQTTPFVDRKSLEIKGGKGGDGCIAFTKIFAKEFAGPDGGDGGNGGHVLFQATHAAKSLVNVPSLIKGADGGKGNSCNCEGANGKHLIINVPLGTIFKSGEGEVVADLNEEGALFLGARGGAGGKGNKFFASAVNQSPELAEFGAEGEQRRCIAEMATIANFGLVGYPNAGKSTLLRAISRARPKVASYAFTTVKPHVGVVFFEDLERVTVADIPGIIEDAHRNRGLGIDFLRHIKRCLCLIYVIDFASPDPLAQFHSLHTELSEYDPELVQKKWFVVANKMDVEGATDKFNALKDQFGDLPVIPISGKCGINLKNFLQQLRSVWEVGAVDVVKEVYEPVKESEVKRWR